MSHIDQEVLELAAKAAGVELEWFGAFGTMISYTKDSSIPWNPHESNHKALALMMKLNLNIRHHSFLVPESHFIRVGIADWDGVKVMVNGNPEAAARKGIVLAAAYLGRNGYVAT
jgi:hypothetical protein